MIKNFGGYYFEDLEHVSAFEMEFFTINRKQRMVTLIGFSLWNNNFGISVLY